MAGGGPNITILSKKKRDSRVDLSVSGARVKTGNYSSTATTSPIRVVP